jgi:hypothetical protein
MCSHCFADRHSTNFAAKKSALAAKNFADRFDLLRAVLLSMSSLSMSLTWHVTERRISTIVVGVSPLPLFKVSEGAGIVRRRREDVGLILAANSTSVIDVDCKSNDRSNASAQQGMARDIHANRSLRTCVAQVERTLGAFNDRARIARPASICGTGFFVEGRGSSVVRGQLSVAIRHSSFVIRHFCDASLNRRAACYNGLYGRSQDIPVHRHRQLR